MRIAAPFSPQAAQVASDLGVRRELDASKAERLLVWKTRPAAASIIDAAESLIEKNLL